MIWYKRRGMLNRLKQFLRDTLTILLAASIPIGGVSYAYIRQVNHVSQSIHEQTTNAAMAFLVQQQKYFHQKSVTADEIVQTKSQELSQKESELAVKNSELQAKQTELDKATKDLTQKLQELKSAQSQLSANASELSKLRTRPPLFTF